MFTKNLGHVKFEKFRPMLGLRFFSESQMKNLEQHFTKYAKHSYTRDT